MPGLVIYLQTHLDSNKL